MEAGNITKAAATFKSFLQLIFCESDFYYFHETNINR